MAIVGLATVAAALAAHRRGARPAGHPRGEGDGRAVPGPAEEAAIAHVARVLGQPREGPRESASSRSPPGVAPVRRRRGGAAEGQLPPILTTRGASP